MPDRPIRLFHSQHSESATHQNGIAVELNSSTTRPRASEDPSLTSSPLTRFLQRLCGIPYESMNSSSPTRLVYANGGKEAHPEFPSNQQRNAKYTLLNFIPLNLWEQFSLFINRYFLLIACLQLISIITPVSPVTTWGPLIIIFSVSAAKEAIDDRGRANDDRLANQRRYRIYLPAHDARRDQYPEAKDEREVLIASQDIHVGDIIRLQDGEEVPCDVCLLASSSPDGQCMVQTMNLDGETNLKVRRAPSKTQSLATEEIQSFKGVVECSSPNSQVYTFDARLWMSAEEQETNQPTAYSISGDQLLQQTIKLRNTAYVYGVCMYTGSHTKYSQNKGVVRLKRTQVDGLVNQLAVYLFTFQFTLVIIFGIVGNLQFDPDGSKGERWYLYLLSENQVQWYEWFIIPARFLLLNSTIIPISLKITLDVCKLYYSRFIGWDARMYDEIDPEKTEAAEQRGTQPAIANNTSISEDLGQVAYCLTDKTGTLTQNEMVFQMCSIAGRLFDRTQCRTSGDLSRFIEQQNREILEFARNIVLNNEVTPTMSSSDPPERLFKSPSPDEEALVVAAASVGVVLEERDGPNITISVNGKQEHYLLVQQLDFSSDRRRMSVVVRSRDSDEGTLRLYCKGADDVIFERISQEKHQTIRKQTQSHIDSFASNGLRTLLFAHRTLDEQHFAEWHQEYTTAKASLENRDEKVARVCEKLEIDLDLCGASAIEDRLQDNVPETIRLLRQAGVRFWMLTGDKFSTALQIAKSCNLTQLNAQVHEIKGTRPLEVQKELHEYLETTNPASSYNIILRGSSLAACLDPLNTAEFLQFCLASKAVICCRFAPRQKAQMVKLVKEAGHVTLAIGDGGNDVSMIQEAHVGVGIRGKEGLQAARASDYQINYFRSLQPLLLIHGRQSYLRTSLVAQYSYYKSFMFCSFQILFAFSSSFSGTTLFNSTCTAAYNALLFIPICSLVLDQDLPGETIYQIGRVYKLCQRSVHFNYLTYLLWMMRAVFQAVVVFLIIVSSYSFQYHLGDKGIPGDYETLGVAVFCAFLWVQTLTLLYEMRHITLLNQAFIWGSHLFFFLLMIFTNALLSFNSLFGYYSFFFLLGDPIFWLSNLVAVLVALAPILAISYYQANYHPTLIDVARVFLRQHPDKPLPNIEGRSPYVAAPASVPGGSPPTGVETPQ